MNSDVLGKTLSPDDVYSAIIFYFVIVGVFREATARGYGIDRVGQFLMLP